MDSLKQSAEAFKELLDKEYLITVARKRQKTEFKLIFEEWDFKHLSGMQKLTDLDYHKMPAGVIFKDILKGRIKDSDLQRSEYFADIAERLDDLKNLERYLDNNMLVYKWDIKNSPYSKIGYADYVFKENIPDEKKAYVFLREKLSSGTIKKLKIEEIKKTSAISFFLDSRDITKYQVVYTLLRNEKVDIKNKSSLILYDFEALKKNGSSKT